MPREKKPETETVRLDKSLIKRIRRVTGHLGISVPDWLADRLEPILKKEERALLKDLAAELKTKDSEE